MKNKQSLPTIYDLYKDESLKLSASLDAFNAILSQPPPKSWVKTHPYISGHKYLPIDKVEWMLKRIFKQYKITITDKGTAFNGVFVTVRVEYFHPILDQWMHHDGIGAMALQVKKGTSPADLSNINNGAISMAFPIAKSLAVKDATDHLGDAFGANLNRKDVMPFNPDERLIDIKNAKEAQRLERLIKACEIMEELENLKSHVEKNGDESLSKLWNKRNKELNNEKV